MGHWPPGAHTSTFMGDAVNLAAGSAAIGVLRDERLAERSATLGAAGARAAPVGARRRAAASARSAASGCSSASSSWPTATTRDARPRHGPRGSGAPRSTAACVLGSGGHHENVIKLCPPLTIDEDLLDTALDLTIDAIRGTR